jgi:hypothetical protein
MSVAPQETQPSIALDMDSYQRFWDSVPVSELERYAGQMVAVAPAPQGWQIVAGAASLEALIERLENSGTDRSSVVFDSVHMDDHTSAGIELQ